MENLFRKLLNAAKVIKHVTPDDPSYDAPMALLRDVIKECEDSQLIHVVGHKEAHLHDIIKDFVMEMDHKAIVVPMGLREVPPIATMADVVKSLPTMSPIQDTPIETKDNPRKEDYKHRAKHHGKKL